MTSLVLREGWTWRQAPVANGTTRLSLDLVEHFTSTNDDFAACSAFPTEVHVELLAAGRIPDPFLADNEEKVQWVGEASWLFRCAFTVDPKHGETTDLVFDGLDTFAHVWLDGKLVHENDNGFMCDQRIDVTTSLKGRKDHVLLIQFESAFLRGKDLQAKSEFKANAWNGDVSRCYGAVRKPQYHWGWDWGPTLLTCGPTGNITLHSYTCRVLDFYPRVEVDQQLAAAIVVDFEVSGRRHQIEDVFVRITDPDDRSQDVDTAVDKHGRVAVRHSISRPQLWWPANMGRQPLYRVEVFLVDAEGRLLATESKRVGLRRIRLVQEPVEGEPGTSFVFEVNNVKLFAGGSNWIPGDSLLTRMTPSRYRKWLELARDGNQNMIRVWGGGIYETNTFYNLCDELGLLVWQDFPFACGLYPADDAFCANVKREAEANLKRIRHHASLALLAGNNEDYQIAEAEGKYHPDSDEDHSETFPARRIYEHLLPEVVARLTSPAVVYRPGSPWTGGDTRDPHRGDAHQWSVWHGSQERYQDWDKLLNRFASEWGMQGYPDIRTVDYWLDGNTDECYPQSRLMAQHQKADGGERRIAVYLEENFRHGNDLASYGYTTQLMQADCVRYAVQTWRRRFRGHGAYSTAGSLVWQLNDVWPVVSWSIADALMRPKGAYFAMKRALSPLALGSKRSSKRIYDDERTAAHYRSSTTINFWLSNTSCEAVHDLSLEFRVVDLARNETISKRVDEMPTIEAMSCYEIDPIDFEDDQAVKVAQAAVVSAIVKRKKTGEVVARIIDWPEPFKYLRFPYGPKSDVRIEIDTKMRVIRIESKRFLKGLIFTLATDEVQLLDNCLDVMPGDPQTIGYRGVLKSEHLSWRYLYQDEAEQ